MFFYNLFNVLLIIVNNFSETWGLKILSIPYRLSFSSVLSFSATDSLMGNNERRIQKRKKRRQWKHQTKDLLNISDQYDKSKLPSFTGSTNGKHQNYYTWSSKSEHWITKSTFLVCSRLLFQTLDVGVFGHRSDWYTESD